MKNFTFFNTSDISKFIQHRENETKFGEGVETVSELDQLARCDAEYVLFGVPEDLGVIANFGKPGTSKTFQHVLSYLLNIQNNKFNRPVNLVLLGQINCSSFYEEAESLNPKSENYKKQLGDIVTKIDGVVTAVVKAIIESGKTPIVIGGGHNNCYGIIKGTSTALEKPINVLNIDAHTDLRIPDYRHSGNGFRYAFEENYLNKYHVFGLHKNYTSQEIFDFMDHKKVINYFLYEDGLHLTTLDKCVRLKNRVDFLNGTFGFELDCDAIGGMNSSAETPSGFSIRDIRTFIKLIKKEQVHYFHICEADASKDKAIGKTISYFISDFIRDDD
jgi:formiminoglutamase